MIKQIYWEIVNRIILIIIMITLTTIISIIYANDIMLLLLNPIKEVNNDIHNNLIYKIINNSYSQFDMEKKKEYIINKKIDYLPSCEISIKVESIWKIITKIMINIIILWAYLIIHYQIILIIVPSIYKKEKRLLWNQYIKNAIKIWTSLYLTHTIWTKIYWKISLHNYNEYNYYEFDISFDMNEYINNYIKIIYITIIILTLKKKQIQILILMLSWIWNINNIIEIIYLYIIKKTKDEINNWIKIKSNKP